MSAPSTLVTILVGTTFVLTSALPQRIPLTRGFNYEGEMPIREEEAGKPTNGTSGTSLVTMRPEDQAAAEAACWTLIREESAVTFALQSRVLDRFQAEMTNLTMKPETREKIETIIKSLRRNMLIAGNSLISNEADVFFDALFESSEDILRLAAFLRDPSIEDAVFVSLGRTVSYLGRNNAALIQQFTQMCSFMHRSPKPRIW